MKTRNYIFLFLQKFFNIVHKSRIKFLRNKEITTFRNPILHIVWKNKKGVYLFDYITVQHEGLCKQTKQIQWVTHRSAEPPFGTNQAVQKCNLSCDILKYITIIRKMQISIEIEIYSTDGSWLFLNKFWNIWTTHKKIF